MNQINEHFIFNALNTIKCEIIINSPDAAQLVNDFAKYLRYSLNVPELGQRVSLRSEMEIVRAYARLEMARFSKVHVEFDLCREDFPVLPMCILPLVENAVHHGLCRRRGEGIVRIRSRRMEKGFQIAVSDNGVGFDKEELVSEKNRTGSLADIAFRIEHILQGKLDIESRKNAGTRVGIWIPDEI